MTYYHVVFTLPHALNGWAQLHPRTIYRSLFAAAWATLKAFGADRRRLGGQMGMIAVLHTWGQRLDQHIHLHCLIPGVAPGADQRWRAARGSYLFPVRALSRRFRGRLVSTLRAEAGAGALHRAAAEVIDRRLAQVMQEEVVVYAKPCLNHRPETVVDYLGRYTHRIAISNARILAVDEASVRFRYTDYADRNRTKVMCLAGQKFVRRFLLHVLPKGFMRVRHFGFLANRCRRAKLQLIREVLDRPAANDAEASGADDAEPQRYICPACQEGELRTVAMVPGVSPRRETG